MKGQLWQTCDECGTEPVCVDCMKCAIHCDCKEQEQQKLKKIKERNAPCGFCANGHFTMLGFECLVNADYSIKKCPKFCYSG